MSRPPMVSTEIFVPLNFQKVLWVLKCEADGRELRRGFGRRLCSLALGRKYSKNDLGGGDGVRSKRWGGWIPF